MTQPAVFISYSHDSDAHVEWSLEFAATLAERGDVRTVIDMADYDRTLPWNAFCAFAIDRADFVVTICTAGYKTKAEALTPTTGVGVETVISLATFYQAPQKFVPVIRESLADGEPAVPFYLKGYQYFDFRTDESYDDEMVEVIRVLRGVTRYVLDVAPHPPGEADQTVIRPRPPRAATALQDALAAASFVRAELRDEFTFGRAGQEAGRYRFVPPRLAKAHPLPDSRSSDPTGLPAMEVVQSHLDASPGVLALLGEYGCGKSTFCRYLVSELIGPSPEASPNSLLPILARVRQASALPQNLLDWLLALFRRENLSRGAGHGALPETYDSWRALTERARVVLIVDGLDEATVPAGGSAESVFFDMISLFSNLRCTTIATSRLHFPPVLPSASPAYSPPAVPGAVWFFTEFSHADVEQYVSEAAVDIEHRAGLLRLVRADSSIATLAQKPLFANLLLDQPTLAGITPGDAPNLYERIVTSWAATARTPSSLTSRDILRFLEEVAFMMFVSNRREVPRDELLQYTHAHFGPRQAAARADIDVDQASFLIRTTSDSYAFSHTTFIEFLVARKLARELTAFDNHSLYVRLLTPAINHFLLALLTTSSASPAKGPQRRDVVIVSEDDRYDRLVGRSLEAFDIDRYPVTCREYAAFLEACPDMVPPTSEGADMLGELGQRPDVDWFVRDIEGYLQACRRFCWDPVTRHPPQGQSQWPVMYVSYFDAWAYCRWAGRALPSPVQWLKAGAWDADRGAIVSFSVVGEAKPGYNCNCESVFGEPSPVDELPDARSYFGCHHMLGNVSEWADGWADEEQRYRAAFGGSWHLPLEQCAASAPVACLPNLRRNFVGFRTVSSQAM